MAVTAPREKLFQEMTRSRAWPQGHRGGKGGWAGWGKGEGGSQGMVRGCQQVGTAQGQAMTWVQSGETHTKTPIIKSHYSLYGTKHILLLL